MFRVWPKIGELEGAVENQDPEGPSTQIAGSLVPKSIL